MTSQHKLWNKSRLICGKRTISGLGVCAFVTLLLAASFVSVSAMDDQPASASDTNLTPWKIHAAELLKRAGESTPQSLSQAQTQYDLASRIRPDPLLNHALAIAMYQHGKFADAERLNQQVWNDNSPNSGNVASLQTRLLLKLRNTAGLIDFTKELLKRSQDATCPPTTQTELAHLAGRIVRLLEDTRISKSKERQDLQELGQSARNIPDSRIVQAYSDGYDRVEQLFTSGPDETGVRDAEKAADIEKRLKQIRDAEQTAEQQKNAIAAQQSVTAQELESQINQLDVSLSKVEIEYNRLLPQWQLLAKALPNLLNGREVALNNGFKTIVVDGTRYSAAQIDQAARSAQAQYDQINAALGQVAASGTALIEERRTLEGRYRQLTGQLIKANQSVSLLQQKMDRQRGSLKASAEESKQKRLGTAEKQELAIPFDVDSEIESLRQRIAASSE